MKIKKLFIFCIFYCALPGRTDAQRVETYTVDDGLPQGFVTSICQDGQGYIWAATLNGLSRFDGVHFKNYLHDPADNTSLANNHVFNLLLDADKRLWVFTERGVQVYDPAIDKFGVVDFIEKEGHKGLISTLGIDNNNNIWCNTEDSILCCQIVKTDMPPYLRLKKRHEAGMDILKKDFFYITKDNESALIGYKDGVQIVNLKHRSARWLFRSELGTIFKIQENKAAQEIWLTTNTGVFLWKNAQLRHWDSFKDRAVERISIKDREHLIHVGNYLFIWDGVHLERVIFPSSERIISTLVDDSGILWLGTDSRGMKKIAFPDNHFKILLPNTYIGTKAVEDPKGDLWYSRNNSKALTRRYENLTRPSRQLPNIGQGEKYFTNWDRHGNLWVLSNNKLTKVTLSGNKQTYHVPATLETNEWHDIQCAPDGKVIIISNTLELRALSPISGEWIQSSFREYSSVLNFSNLKNSLSEWKTDQQGRIWAALIYGALMAEINWEKSTVNYTFLARKDRLPDAEVISIAPDERFSQAAWVGTAAGLFYWNLSIHEVTAIVSKDIGPDEVIYGLVAASSGRLWAGTQKGLAEYHPEQATSRFFTKEDGLPASEFNRNTGVRLSNGSIILGTVEGMIHFSPEEIGSPEVHNRMVITEVALANKILKPSGAGWQLPEFPHDQNYFRISFSLLDYQSPASHLFRYRINGGEWTYTDHHREVLLAGLKPGKYEFDVQGSDGKSDWITTPAHLCIVINPPWWQTWWAYILFAIAIAALPAVFIINRLKIQQFQFQLEKEQQISELEQFKSQIIANVAHELRTPLTVILGMGAELKGVLTGAPKSMLEAMLRSADDVNRLACQMTDLSRLRDQTKEEELMTEGDLVEFLKLQAGSFHYLIKKKRLKLKIELPDAPVYARYDQDGIKSILTNLLSNAIKFTPANGLITLRLQRTSEDKIEITVADTGIGIPEEKRPHIFKRFFKVEPSSTNGTGIGLAHTQALVQMMAGTITVTGKEGPGSVFTVTLPLTVPEQLRPEAEVAEKETVERDQKETPDKPVILIVEDHEDTVAYLKLCLHQKYKVEHTDRSDAAEQWALEHIPDLAVLDVSISDESDGIALCRRLKAHPNTSHIPVVILTGHQGQEDINRALEAGADAYMTKPFDRNEFLLRLDNLLLQRSRMQVFFQDNMDDDLPASQQAWSSFSAKDQEFLHRFEQLLHEKYNDSEFDVHDMERELSMSKTLLHRKISALTGQTPGKLLSDYRLMQARKLLDSDQGMMITEVAYSCGFNSASYFSTAFRQKFGISPKKYSI